MGESNTIVSAYCIGTYNSIALTHGIMLLFHRSDIFLFGKRQIAIDTSWDPRSSYLTFVKGQNIRLVQTQCLQITDSGKCP